MTNYKISIKANRNSHFVNHIMTKAEFIKFADECRQVDRTCDHDLNHYLDVPAEYIEVEDQIDLILNREISEDEWFRAGINYFERDGGQVVVEELARDWWKHR